MEGRSRRRTYYATTAALFVLLGLTLGAAYLPLGAFGPVLAMAIAAAKALLVALFFMHLSHRKGVTWIFALGGVVWLSLLFALTFADYAARGGELAQSQSWSEEATPAGAPAPLPEGRPGVRRQIDTETTFLDGD